MCQCVLYLVLSILCVPIAFFVERVVCVHICVSVCVCVCVSICVQPPRSEQSATGFARTSDAPLPAKETHCVRRAV